MRRTTALSLTALLLSGGLIAWVDAPAHPEGIEGTWLVTSDDESHQRGAFMFTSDGSYAQLWVRGDEPRANTEEDWTAEQLVASYRELTANLGRVSMDGNEINFEAYMANSPTYMNGWPDNDQTATFEMHGDDRMTLTMASGREFLLRRP